MGDNQTPVRVLFVDDEPAISQAAELFLKKEGYDVYAFHNPLQALQSTAKFLLPFDCAVIDWEMPNLSGIELYRKMSARQASFPVIFTSGLDLLASCSIPLPQHCLFVAKPFQFQEIISAVKTLIHGTET